MEGSKSNNKYIAAALAVILAYLSPLCILGQNAHVLLLDNIDGAVASLKVLAQSGQVFGGLNSAIPNIMNGLLRNTMGSEFNLQVLLYWAFKPFTAYVINLTLVHLLAFLGMYLLLKHYVLKDHEVLAVGVALAFALLPFWPYGGLSVAGQPLALYAFLNIRARVDQKYDWLILLLIPFYSSLIYSFAFFLFLMGLWWLYEAVVKKQVNGRWLAAMFIMGLVYLLVEYRLLYNIFFDPGFVSIRSEFPLYRIEGKRAALKQCIDNFVFGQFHAASLQQLVILPAALAALLIAGIKKRRPYLLLGLLFLTGIISIWYGFWFFKAWVPVKQQIPFLAEVNLSRFHWLHPLLWYVIFALALKIILEAGRAGKYLVAGLLVLQVGFLFYNNDEITQRKLGVPSYKEFYAEHMHQEIARFIGKDQKDYRVVSLGMHPAITQYNGFYTLDAYVGNYPLEYKHEFRKIMAGELEKSPFYRDYFDHLGGSRCYLFVEKLMYNTMMTKENNIVIEELTLDSAQLKKMGGRYLFSALDIQNSKDIGLKLLRVFEEPDSAWRIYLYEVS